MTTKRTQLIGLLTSQTSRENAFSVLQEKIKTGREIKEFAKFLDLPVTGNLTDIKNRIVQTTVGRRLESEAIQQKSLSDAAASKKSESSDSDFFEETEADLYEDEDELYEDEDGGYHHGFDI
jgi:hypothetical protein